MVFAIIHYSFNFDVVFDNDGSNGKLLSVIWIDYNNNGIFEADEQVYNEKASALALNGNIFIPASVPVGYYRMRLRGLLSNNANQSPCTPNPIDGGNMIDFVLEVIPEPDCLPPADLTVSSVTPNSATLEWASSVIVAPPIGTPIQLSNSFDLEWMEVGVPLGNGNLVEGLAYNYLLDGLEPNHDYSFYVRQVCDPTDGNSFWIGPYTFTTECDTPSISLWTGDTINVYSGLSSTSYTLKAAYQDSLMTFNWYGLYSSGWLQQTSSEDSLVVTSSRWYKVEGTDGNGCLGLDSVYVNMVISNLSVNPSTINLSAVKGMPVHKNIRVKNNGTQNETIYSVNIDAPFYTDFTGPVILAPNDQVDITLSLLSNQSLFFQEELEINTSALTYNIPVSTQYVDSVVTWLGGGDVEFLNTLVGGSSISTLSFANSGNVHIPIDSIWCDNPAFDIVSIPDTAYAHVPPEQHYNYVYSHVNVKFQPDQVGFYEADLFVRATFPELTVLKYHVSGFAYISGPKPEIQFETVAPYNGVSGVDKEVGGSSDLFTYRVVYKSPSNQPPMVGYPKVGIDWDGNHFFTDVNEETYSMVQVGNGTDWVNGESFVYSTTLEEGSSYGYQFFAIDSLGNTATLQVTNYQTGPLVTNQALDLSIFADDITFSEINPGEGETFTTYAVIHNSSPYPADNIPIHFSLEDTLLLGRDTIGHLPAFSTVTISKDLSFDTSGWYPIKVWIDSAGTLNENNVLNNYAIRPVSVGDVDLPGKITTTSTLPNYVNVCNPPNDYMIYGYASYDSLMNNTGHPPVAGGTVMVSFLNPLTGDTLAKGYTVTSNSGYWGMTFTYFYLDIMSSIVCGEDILQVVDITDFTFSGQKSNLFTKKCGDNCTPWSPLNLSLTFNSCDSAGHPLPIEVYAGFNQLNINPIHDINLEIQLGGDSLWSQHVDSIYPGHFVQFNDTLAGIDSVGIFDLKLNFSYRDSLDNFHQASLVKNLTLMTYPDLVLFNAGSNYRAIKFTEHNNNCITAHEHKIFLYQYSSVLGDYVLIDSINSTEVGSDNYFTIDLPTLDYGNHYFRLETDPYDEVIESNESNNTLDITVTKSRPDLLVEKIEASTHDWRAGNAVNFRAKIKNPGTASDSFMVVFYLNSQPFDSIRVDSLGTGQALTLISSPYTILGDSCLDTIAVKVDVLMEVEEGNENNNYLAVSAARDLSPFFRATMFQQYYTFVNADMTIPLYIQNKGLKDVHDSVRVIYEIPGELFVDTILIGGIPSANERNLSFVHNFSQMGVYQLTATVDPFDAICEENEMNNTTTVDIHIMDHMPDFEILSQHISPSLLNPNPGDSVSIVASVFNTGIQTSDSTSLRFWVDNVPLGDDIPLLPISPGGDSTVSATVRYASNIQGPKIIRATADVKNLVVEFRENNNTATRAIIVGPAPDISSNDEALTISNPNANGLGGRPGFFNNGMTPMGGQLGTDPVRRGDTVVLSNYLKNFGDSTGTGYLKFLVTNNYGITKTLDSVAFTIGGQDSTRVSLSWVADFVGEGKVTTVIEHVSPMEFDTLNNRDELTIEVGPMLRVSAYDASDTVICQEGTTTFEATIASDEQPLSFTWKKDGLLVGSDDPFLTIDQATEGDAGLYQLTIEDDFGYITAAVTELQVNPKVAIVAEPIPNLEICDGNVLSLRVDATHVGSYQWQHNQNPIPGATEAELYLDNMDANQEGDYQVVLASMEGCSFDTVSAPAHISVAVLSASLAEDGAVDSFNHHAHTTYVYTDEQCRPIVKLTTENVALDETKVKIKEYANLEGYVNRGVDITPTHQGEAEVVLYFTQADFDAYNVWAEANSESKLPESPTDAHGLNNLRVIQFHGTAESGTTGPGGDYSTEQFTEITNDELNISWEATEQRWAVQLTVSQYSGFFVSGILPNPLASIFTGIKAINQGSENLVTWEMAAIEEGYSFEIYRSLDGRDFELIDKREADAQNLKYQFVDKNPMVGDNFYRVLYKSMDEEGTYSAIVSARMGRLTKLEVVPNPTKDFIQVSVGQVSDDAYLLLTDVSGRLIQKVPVKTSTLRLDMSALTAGMYLLRYVDADYSEVVKVTKR